MFNCIISDNRSVRGGGVYCKGVGPLVVNCLIARNVAVSDDGGGVYGGATLRGCTIAANETGRLYGGVMSYPEWPAGLRNCIVWQNEAVQAGECTIAFSDVQDGYGGEGNIELDPLFVDFGGGDYHLRPSSPCVDRGDPRYVPPPGELDLDQQRRAWDGDGDRVAVVDMGADEFGSYAYGDLNCDGARNFADINPFVLALGEPEEYRRRYPACEVTNADCNGDGRVDFGDINAFVEMLSG